MECLLIFFHFHLLIVLFQCGCAKKIFSLQHTPKGILVHNVICSSNATRNVLENVCFCMKDFWEVRLGSHLLLCMCMWWSYFEILALCMQRCVFIGWWPLVKQQEKKFFLNELYNGLASTLLGLWTPSKVVLGIRAASMKDYLKDWVAISICFVSQGVKRSYLDLLNIYKGHFKISSVL